MVSSSNTKEQTSTMQEATATVDSSATNRRQSDLRRSNKPIMEKRRRARINNCLSELKTLILDAMKKDPARHSKLEKADILEMTVKHLQNLQRQQASIAVASDSSVVNKFRAGFSECAVEVGRFHGLDSVVKRKLLQHLANCLNQTAKQQNTDQLQVHIVPSSINSVDQSSNNTNGIIFSNCNPTGVQLVSTRLPNGDIALVLPSNNQLANSNLPLLVPIQQRISSSISDSSSNYSPSPSHSPEPLDNVCNQVKPLALVMRKPDPPSEEKPWRPW